MKKSLVILAVIVMILVSAAAAEETNAPLAGSWYSAVNGKPIQMNLADIDKTAQEIGKWCSGQGWDPAICTKVELVFEEKMMNLYDHAYDEHVRAGEQACFKLQKKADCVELSFWDFGTQEPSIFVTAGNSELELELRNRHFSDRGRGRLMVREMCKGIERNRFGNLNETIYRIAVED